MNLLASLFLLAATKMSSASWLRLIQINDVYQLDNFPHLKTLIDQHKEGPHACVMVCCGDFLAPSLLSSLDKGVGMVDVLNEVGCDYCCLGNHETDIPMDALVQRMKQSNFVWINSNLPDLNERLQVSLPKYDILKVGKRKVALLGLLTEDPSLYRPGSFRDATIQPVMENAKDMIDELKDKVDLILPLTHQGIAEDRTMAQTFGNADLSSHGFPLLLGGHDHEVYQEYVDHCHIVKTGMDAENAAVIDIRWNDDDESSPTAPTIDIQMLRTTDYPANQKVLDRVRGHQSILKELDKAKLFAIKDWVFRNDQDDDDDDDGASSTTPDQAIFSTKDNRLGPSTGSTALCSMIRMGLRCQVAIVNAGCIRAGQEYGHDEFFTWSNLKAEMPYSTNMCVCHMPGQVLQDTIQYSRRFAKDGIAKGGYIHTSRTTICNDQHEIQSILGEPFDPEKEYLVAFPHGFLTGIDNHKPLLDWAAAKKPEELPNLESALPAKNVIVEVMSALFWLRLGSFREIAGDDGVIRKDDLRAKMKDIYGGNAEIAELMLDNVFAIADKDKNGTISALEQLIVNFAASDMLQHCPTENEVQVMKQIVAQVLGNDPANGDVDQTVELLRKSLDLRGTGSVQREEILLALGEIAGKNLLE